MKKAYETLNGEKKFSDITVIMSRLYYKISQNIFRFVIIM